MTLYRIINNEKHDPTFHCQECGIDLEPATIDYEAAKTEYDEACAALIGDETLSMDALCAVVDAAVGQLSNRHQLVVDTNIGEKTP